MEKRRRLLNAFEVAEILRVKEKTVKWYTKSGKLIAKKLSPRHLVYETEDVERFIDDGEKTGLGWKNMLFNFIFNQRKEI